MKRDCACPRAGHQHGTYEAYKRDRCRCTPCCRANSRYSKTTAHRKATGRGNLVDAAAARAHVEQLLAAGLTVGQIERRSGMNRTAVRKLIGDLPGKPASVRVRRDAAAAVLAVRPEQVGTETGGLVDGTGTARRVQALVALGWTMAGIAARIGMTPANFTPVAHGRRTITPRTRRAVADVYDELWDQQPPVSRGTSFARSYAARRQWVPPLAWDDDTIDDPAATPAAVLRGVDDGLVDDVTWLLDSGAGRAEIVARLSVRDNTLEITLRRRAPEVWQRVIAVERSRREQPRRAA